MKKLNHCSIFFFFGKAKQGIFKKCVFPFLILFFFFCGKTIAQCPSGNFTFTTQQQIDDFGAMYAHCNDITLGDISIYFDDIANLDGLSQVKTITGELILWGANQLTDINGLSSLESIGGALWVHNASQLTNLDGFSSLQTVGNFNIQNNNALTDISGLSGLSSAKEVSIYNNPLLTNLDALSGLVTIGGSISISENNSLTDISGLQNIAPETITHLTIRNNTDLSVCNLPNFCTYLSDEINPRTISGNAGFCLNEQDVNYHCLPCPTLEDDFTFNNQQQIDNFGEMYLHCDDIVLRNLTISGGDITNLDGLSHITGVTGNLTIQYTQLTDLNLFSNFTGIGGNLTIAGNSLLTTLDGLSNITIVEGNLDIGYNSLLINIDGLANLTSIEGGIHIFNHPVLTNISGLANIEFATITGLNIENNPQLSVCNLPNFCIYLSDENNPRTINNNAGDCISSLAVKNACAAACPTGDYIFTTQAQIDAFGAYSYCGNITINSLTISGYDITNLNGLSNIESIGGFLRITENTTLTNLDGLSNLTQIGGHLFITENSALTDISGLANIEFTTITGLNITNNPQLSVCNLPNFCAYLSDVNNSRTISGNAGFCLDEQAVTYHCLPCPSGDFTFNNQAEIDDFGAMYAHCTDIVLGNVTISGNDITNLDGLSNVTGIGGQLYIMNNPSLTNISGLANIDPETIGGTWGLYIVDNPSLSVCNLPNFCTYLSDETNTRTISGNAGFCLDEQAVTYHCLPCPSGDFTFNNQAEIDDFGAMYAHCTDIVLGNVTISGNDITNLDGLSNVTDIGGQLYIMNNPSLTDISGLANIDPETIGGTWGLYIVDNPSLSVCNLPNFCTYLSDETNTRTISGNADFCLDEQAVTYHCLPCPTGGFNFFSQQAINDFGTMYAHCTDITLNNVTISGNDITNLDGLSNIKTITGQLDISSTSLTNTNGLSGLQGLNRVDISFNSLLTDISLNGLTNGSRFSIYNNPALTGISLNELTNVSTFFRIYNNGLLTGISLNGLTNVEYDLEIYNNSQLTNLNGLSALTNVGYDFKIYNNNQLTNLDGLSALTSVKNLTISSNPQLTDISGLSALTNIGNSLTITNNTALSTCNILPFCIWLSDENNQRIISGNATGCNDSQAVENACAVACTTLGDFTFTTQAEIDAFRTTYDFCPAITLGNLIISGSDITNLDGLNSVTEVAGYLDIAYNPVLTNIDGLNNLTSIGGYLFVGNNSLLTHIDPLSNLASIGGETDISNNPLLTNLNGLSNLTNVGGELYLSANSALTNLNGLSSLTSIGAHLRIEHNSALTNIEGLNSLTSMGGHLRIEGNNVLGSLDGLNLTSVTGYVGILSNAQLADISALATINPATITGALTITNNPQLSVCNLPNFCAYLSDVNNPRTISGNLANCLDEAAVTAACSIACPTGNFNFTSQQQIDDFGATYAHCTNITLGDVTVYGSGITNLDGLSGLINVEGDFYLYNTNTLTNTNGLNNLTSVGGIFQISSLTATLTAINLSGLTSVNELLITQNNVLTTIDLSSLTSVDNELRITQNNQLTAIDLSSLTNSPANIYIRDNLALANLDLSNLTTVGGLSITNCNQLPNLNTLSNLTTVGSGGLAINSNNALTDIDGLGSLTTVGGSLGILGIPSLTHLDALSNLTTLGGILEIGLPQLTNLDGLSGLTSTGGINFTTNPLLTDINGLSNITTLGGYLMINDVDALTNLDALNALTSIGGRIEITRNALLANLNGLSNVQSIQGEIRIGGLVAGFGNPQLTDISGLANIDPEGITNLYIRHNANLNVCNLPNFCTYLSDETNTKDIRNNAGNCLDAQAVADACAVDCNISGNVVFNTQAQIDAFAETYIHCANITIGGHLTISGSDITNLSGLSNITAITEELWIGSNAQLTNLDGLGNLQNIGDYLLIYNNPQLNNLDGLTNLQSIGGYLKIEGNDDLEDINGLNNLQSIEDYLMIYLNPQLANLDGLSNLTSIGTELHINTNEVLTDISGLQNIDPATIGGTLGLYIKHNPLLSVCNLPNFCEYLSNPANPRTIENNAGDCISIQAVTDACAGNCDSYTIWNGTSWSNNEPDADVKAIIDGDLTLTEDLTACEVLLNSGILTVSSGITLTVNGEIVNTQTADNFIVQNDANLIQVEDIENLGPITVHRNSTPMMRLDYAMWSSPVDEQGIHAFSPQTVASRIYTYEGENGYQLVEDLESDFVAGKGYMFRAPNNWNITTDANEGNPVAYPGKFTGLPFNGDISVDVHSESYTSIGNPYASNIKLGNNPLHTGSDTFLNANPGVGTIYFWTNTYGADGSGGYTGNNWATYTFMGGTSAGFVSDGVTPSAEPNGFIAPGQGFIISMVGAGTSVSFNNSMRTSDEAIFFKGNEEEKSRFWLNLKNADNYVYNQILVGYMEGATLGIDHRIDGRLFGYEGSALYNIIEEEKFSIQGRPVPFETTDVVPLGFRADMNAKYRISLSAYEGLFAEGNTIIYVKDKLLDMEHNLMESDYEFESVQGEFKERFEIVYKTQEAMGTNDFAWNTVDIYKDKDYIVVDSKSEKLLSVELFDMQGRNLYRNTKVNSTRHQIKSDYFGPKILIVRIKFGNEEIVTRKLIN